MVGLSHIASAVVKAWVSRERVAGARDRTVNGEKTYGAGAEALAENLKTVPR
jgi:hypothetical protein